MTTYDPRGGYGHPDHVQVHAVGARAGELAATPVVLEATINRDLLVMAGELAPTMGFELPADFVIPDTSDWFVPATEITHTVDVSGFLEQKRASMQRPRVAGDILSISVGAKYDTQPRDVPGHSGRVVRSRVRGGVVRRSVGVARGIVRRRVRHPAHDHRRLTARGTGTNGRATERRRDHGGGPARCSGSRPRSSSKSLRTNRAFAASRRSCSR